MTKRDCIVCGQSSVGFQVSEPGLEGCECVRCGRYRIPVGFDKSDIGFLEAKEMAKLSGWIRENPDWNLRTVLGLIHKIQTPTVMERAFKLLDIIAKKQPNLDHSVYIGHGSKELNVEFCVAATWSQDKGEVYYLLRTLFARSFISLGESVNTSWIVQLTLHGWEYLQTRRESEGKTAFVAMWFHDSMEDVYARAIYRGILNSGYEPHRVDKKEHNNDITDEILAGIRSAKFLVADFTQQRAGVYYEAGFAEGLGKPVIRTVRKDEMEKIHFDTRQLNHITWEFSKLDDFASAIKNRILATLGPGPLSGSNP